ncbi:hypothetical protein BV25DRAFT_120546 [Artomyces pyxidatus]|uniref:Uncharacterized protein n=1 Tax=Artomyces pyxidatus TaxID=48021 RepID=A0ACB8TLC8_9AGAM|nr:hypothetical protein BV25DRAFT_120546 [Artomyces pyxidatus]
MPLHRWPVAFPTPLKTTLTVWRSACTSLLCIRAGASLSVTFNASCSQPPLSCATNAAIYRHCGNVSRILLTYRAAANRAKGLAACAPCPMRSVAGVAAAHQSLSPPCACSSSMINRPDKRTHQSFTQLHHRSLLSSIPLSVASPDFFDFAS